MPHPIGVVGTGYVGLVSAVCFAHLGHDVVCMDVDEAKIGRLERGEVPIYEPGLEKLVGDNAARLSFTTSYDVLLERCDSSSSPSTRRRRRPATPTSRACSTLCARSRRAAESACWS